MPFLWVEMIPWLTATGWRMLCGTGSWDDTWWHFIICPLWLWVWVCFFYFEAGSMSPHCLGWPWTYDPLVLFYLIAELTASGVASPSGPVSCPPFLSVPMSWSAHGRCCAFPYGCNKLANGPFSSSLFSSCFFLFCFLLLSLLLSPCSSLSSPSP